MATPNQIGELNESEAVDALGMRDDSSRHPRGNDVQESRFDLGNPGLDLLQPTLVVAKLGSGLMSPSPAGPGQYKVRRREGHPYQPPYLGYRQRYQSLLAMQTAPFSPVPL